MKALKNGRVEPITSEGFEGTVLIDGGKIVDFGADIEVPDDAEVIDVEGKTIVPGFIDAHCHVGISEEGEGWEGEDTNEIYEPITPHLRALDAINPDGLALKEAVDAGVTTINVGPGSSNPIGGTFVAIKTAGSSIVDELVIKEPTGLKMATGENPKRVYKEQKKIPSTRMSTAALIREKLFDVKEYMENGEEKDFKLEALKPLLERELPGRIHARDILPHGRAVGLPDWKSKVYNSSVLSA